MDVSLETEHAPGKWANILLSFLKLVLVHIKLTGMKHRIPGKQNILNFYTPSIPGMGSKGPFF